MFNLPFARTRLHSALLGAAALAAITAFPATSRAGIAITGPGGETAVLNAFVFYNAFAPAGFQYDYQYWVTNTAAPLGPWIDGFNLYTGGAAGLANAVGGAVNFASDADAGVPGFIPATAAVGAGPPAFMTFVDAGNPNPPRWGFVEWDDSATAGHDYLARWFALNPAAGDGIQPGGTRIFNIYSANGPIAGGAFVDPPSGDVLFDLDFANSDGSGLNEVADATDITASVTDVPEPATFTLLAVSASLFILRRRRS